MRLGRRARGGEARRGDTSCTILRKHLHNKLSPHTMPNWVRQDLIVLVVVLAVTSLLACLNGHPFTQPYYDDYLYTISADNCVFINLQAGVIISVYVDDLLIFVVKISRINAVKAQLKREYDSKEVDHILGIRVRRNRKSRNLTLDHSVYINNFISKYGMKNAHLVSTPIDGYAPLTAATPRNSGPIN